TPRIESVNPGAPRERWPGSTPSPSCRAQFVSRTPWERVEPLFRGSILHGGVPSMFSAVVCLMQVQLIGFLVVGKNLRVAAPQQGRFNLAVDFHLREPFVQQIAEKFEGNRMIRFLLQH